MLITQSSGKFLKRKRTINIGDGLLDLSMPCIMGVINISPDSFYVGSSPAGEVEMLEKVEQMLSEGASIIDIGAVSTRPGSVAIPASEELDRLLPAVMSVRRHFPDIALSIDTYRSWIAATIVNEAGPVIINDISGGTLDHKMFDTIGRLQVPYVLTHIQGTPETMQNNPFYHDVVKEVSAFLSEGVRKLTKLGVTDVLIDPGFGFGKNLDHNYKLLNRLDSLKVFQLPVIVGLSRKSMIYNVLDTDPEHALNGTTVANTMALLGGADILRVHDVKEAVDAIRIFLQVKETV